MKLPTSYIPSCVADYQVAMTKLFSSAGSIEEPLT